MDKEPTLEEKRQFVIEILEKTYSDTEKALQNPLEGVDLSDKIMPQFLIGGEEILASMISDFHSITLEFTAHALRLFEEIPEYMSEERLDRILDKRVISASIPNILDEFTHIDLSSNPYLQERVLEICKKYTMEFVLFMGSDFPYNQLLDASLPILTETELRSRYFQNGKAVLSGLNIEPNSESYNALNRLLSGDHLGPISAIVFTATKKTTGDLYSNIITLISKNAFTFALYKRFDTDYNP